MTRFTRPTDDRPGPCGGVDDIAVAAMRSGVPRPDPYSLLEAYRETMQGYRSRAQELVARRQWPGGPERVCALLAEVLALRDANGWYYGDLEELAPGTHLRVVWAILGELVAAGALEAAFLFTNRSGAQRSESWAAPERGPRPQLLRENGGGHTEGQWRDLRTQQGDCCQACGRAEPEVDLTKDHVIPVSLGGPDSLDNLQVLCRACNTAKGATTMDYRASGLITAQPSPAEPEDAADVITRRTTDPGP